MSLSDRFCTAFALLPTDQQLQVVRVIFFFLDERVKLQALEFFQGERMTGGGTQDANQGVKCP